MRKILIGFAAAVAFGSAALGQTSDPTAELSQRFATLWSRGEYLAAIEAIEGAWRSSGSSTLQASYTQNRPALDGFVVLTEAMLQPAPPAAPADLARYEGATAADAIAEILERAKNTRVVIVNEAHDNPRDRAFVLAVAQALRPLGYTHYAAETLTNFGTEEQKAQRLRKLVEDGYPRRNTGSYSDEPMFGGLIRGVLELGYRPVSYERNVTFEEFQAEQSRPREQKIDMREQAQGENLTRAIAAAGPDAKFLIHVGYAHAAERPIPTGPAGDMEWMAARLARMTDIDPLTVDQTDLIEYGGPATRGLHAALVGRVGERPKVFAQAGRPVGFGTLGGATDLQIVHPPIRSVRGRPDWLRQTGRIATEIPTELLPGKGRRLVQVFDAEHANDAVPLDQALVAAGTEPPVLYVPAGRALRWAVQGG